MQGAVGDLVGGALGSGYERLPWTCNVVFLTLILYYHSGSGKLQGKHLVKSLRGRGCDRLPTRPGNVANTPRRLLNFSGSTTCRSRQENIQTCNAMLSIS